MMTVRRILEVELKVEEPLRMVIMLKMILREQKAQRKLQLIPKTIEVNLRITKMRTLRVTKEVKLEMPKV